MKKFMIKYLQRVSLNSDTLECEFKEYKEIVTSISSTDAILELASNLVIPPIVEELIEI